MKNKTSFLFAWFLIMCALPNLIFGQKPIVCDIKAAINNEEAFNKQTPMSTDAAGTNVRSGPGKTFSVVKTLVNQSGFIFSVDAGQGDWVRINSVFEVGTDGSRKLNGWVYAPSLFLKIKHENASAQAGKFVSNLYAAPDWKSKLLLPKNNEIGKNGEGFDDIVSLRGCQGKWAKVAWKNTIGWVNPVSQCSDLWDFCGEK